jgi:serine/threonine-protein kinase
MHQGSSQLTVGIREGDVIAGKYRVERILGQGGMGVVVAARHIQLDTRVAIKFLLPEMLTNREAVGRFAREARAAVKITSEHVARVLDVGTLQTGAPYMVMEFLEGGDLGGWLRQYGALPIEQAAEFVLQACVAIADAHALGIVHRDLKPANLFCVRRTDGQLTIKVLDFGISKATDMTASSSGMAMTRSSAIMGSPLYMSPEQMQSPREVDALTDIWALGVVLFELLTRRVPFGGETYGEIAVKVATQGPPSLRELRPEVPAGLEAVVHRCLQADKGNRYRNVAELAVALSPFAPLHGKSYVERVTGIIHVAGLSATARSVTPSPQLHSSSERPQTIAPVGRTAPGVAVGLKRTATVAGVLGVVAVGVAIAFAVPSKKPSAGAAPPLEAHSSSANPSTPEPTALAPESPVAAPVGSTSAAASVSGAAVSPPAPTLVSPVASPSRALALGPPSKGRGSDPGSTGPSSNPIATSPAATQPREVPPPPRPPPPPSPADLDPLWRLKTK